MEAPHDDQIMGSHSSSSTDQPSPGPSPDLGLALITKRKRTQRIRGATPPVLLLGNSSCTDLCLYNAPDTTTEEEEDTAQCLIMLAQGRPRSPTPAQPEKFTSRRFAETTTSTGGRAGFYVYECKTCNKCFNSFQALGGHRASHKKPKNIMMNDNSYDHHSDMSMKAAVMATPIKVAAPAGGGKLRVHECSICGAEFSSGQALGGHMRRHRPLNLMTAENQESREVKNDNNGNNSSSNNNNNNNNNNNVMLDLNLPAPADDQNHTSSVAFPTRPIVFSSALIDCHY